MIGGGKFERNGTGHIRREIWSKEGWRRSKEGGEGEEEGGVGARKVRKGRRKVGLERGRWGWSGEDGVGARKEGMEQGGGGAILSRVIKLLFVYN